MLDTAFEYKCAYGVIDDSRRDVLDILTEFCFDQAVHPSGNKFPQEIYDRMSTHGISCKPVTADEVKALVETFREVRDQIGKLPADYYYPRELILLSEPNEDGTKQIIKIYKAATTPCEYVQSLAYPLPTSTNLE